MLAPHFGFLTARAFGDKKFDCLLHVWPVIGPSQLVVDTVVPLVKQVVMRLHDYALLLRKWDDDACLTVVAKKSAEFQS